MILYTDEEKALWIGVLETWKLDAKRYRHRNGRFKELFLQEIETWWTIDLCHYVGLDYKAFISEVRKTIYGKNESQYSKKHD